MRKTALDKKAEVRSQKSEEKPRRRTHHPQRLLALCLVALAAGGALMAQAPQTQRMDFPAGGTLHLKRSVGELSVEGWDQSDLEIVAIKTGGSAREQERTRVVAERRGNDIEVSTAIPQHFLLLRPIEGIRPVSLEYRIHVPRAARLNIQHRSGDVSIAGISGEIRAIDGLGQITISLPEARQYSIDAHSRLGDVDSDFPLGQSPPAAQHLYLRIGFGDIVVLQEPNPALQAAASK